MPPHPGKKVGAAVALAVIFGCSGQRASDSASTSMSGETVIAESPPEELVARYMTGLSHELAEGVTLEGDEIRMVWPSEDLFDNESAMLAPAAMPELDRTTDALLRYPETDIIIIAHTDADGDESYNTKLSERQALSLRNFMVEAGVDPIRITETGRGGLDAVAGAQNRRVEITIRPSALLRSRSSQ